MRINNNLSAMNTHRQMGINNAAATKSMEKLSSGMRINRAGDDAAGLSISEKMRSQIVGLDQAAKNAQDGISLIQTAEGALTEVSSMLTRVKELNVQRTNGTYNDNDKESIDLELAQLSEEIVNIVGNTEFNGKNVFGNDFTIAVSHDGTSGTIEIEAATLTDLKALTDAAGIAASNNVATKLADVAIVEVNKQRATYGALQNRLERTAANLGTTSENLTAAESRIRDTDMAKEMMEFTKNNILQQAAQSMLSQANQQPQDVLSLLR